MKLVHRCIFVLSLVVAACSAPQPRDPLAFESGAVRSTDNSTIFYREGGTGATTLVFVHGWLGDSSVWEDSMKQFALHYRVVALDLAGHGASSHDRTQWTVENFASDVTAVVRRLGLQHVVLVGHSMSGPITVEAAHQLGACVEALIPVDTLVNVEWDLPPETWATFFAGFHTDFPGSVESFFRGILQAQTSPKAVIDSIVAKAQRADPASATAMLERAREYDLKSGLRALRIPIHAIDSDMNPVAFEINRKYAPRFEATIITGVGHWPHLEAPERFNAALERVLASLHH